MIGDFLRPFLLLRLSRLQMSSAMLALSS